MQVDARVALLEVSYVAAVLHIGRMTLSSSKGSRNGSKSWMKSTWKRFCEGSHVEKLSEVFAGKISGVFLSWVRERHRAKHVTAEIRGNCSSWCL